MGLRPTAGNGWLLMGGTKVLLTPWPGMAPLGAPLSLLALRTTQPGAGMADEVMTIKDAAELPAFKTRGQWRIKRTEADQWIDAQPRGREGRGRGE
ncbi:MAG: hypothetical protein AB7I09_17730 [Planctomycetota bacterium]